MVKWGNDLVVRLPEEHTLAADLKEGDSVEVEISSGAGITLTPAQSFDKAAFLKKIRKLRAGMTMTSATVETMRRADRY